MPQVVEADGISGRFWGLFVLFCFLKGKFMGNRAIRNFKGDGTGQNEASDSHNLVVVDTGAEGGGQRAESTYGHCKWWL